MWANNQARIIQATINGPSQYHSDLSEQAQQTLELQCLDDGLEYDIRTPIKKFFMKCNRVIGICSGVHTRYVYAEWHGDCNGLVHGRPISILALNRKGINVDD
jgi:hypothetical protein